MWAGTQGKLDDVPVEDIRRFETEFLDHLGRERGAIYDAITSTGELSDDSIAELDKAITDFKQGFTTSDGKLLHVDDHPAEPMDEGEVGREKIKRHHPKQP